MKNGNRQRGLTRTEVVVVGGCLVLLTLVILPALSSGRDAGKRAVCMANLKILGTAALLYARDHEDKIPGLGIEFDEVLEQGDPKADWVRKTTDSLTKAFEYGYLWEYVQTRSPFICPSLTNKMNPKLMLSPIPHGPYLWGWPGGEGTENPPGPMWSYVVNIQAGYSMHDLQYRANPELVLPSPSKIMMLLEEDYMDIYSFDNSYVLFAETYDYTHDFLGAFHSLSGSFLEGTITRKQGLGNIVFFDGHVGSLSSQEFRQRHSTPEATLELCGGYVGFTWPGF